MPRANCTACGGTYPLPAGHPCPACGKALRGPAPPARPAPPPPEETGKGGLSVRPAVVCWILALAWIGLCVAWALLSRTEAPWLLVNVVTAFAVAVAVDRLDRLTR